MVEIPTPQEINLLAMLPIIFLMGWASVMLVVDLFIPDDRKSITAGLAVSGLVGTAVLVWLQARGLFNLTSDESFGGLVINDGYALFLTGVLIVSGIISVLMAVNYLPRRGIERGEYYTLLLFSTGGMIFMAMANDLIVVFIALELLSIPLYILSGFNREDSGSEESAMKYFLLGAFSSGFLVYGVALVYGGTGTTELAGVVAALQGAAINPSIAVIGMGLLLVGLGFKVAAVPFHMWTPDVYQGAPTPVTAFMSIGAKVGGFAALLRVLVAAFPDISTEWGLLVSVIAVLTMIIGNVIAISQDDVKRMLAYSSIAHGGYILVAVAAAQNPEVAPFAISAAIFYLLTYTFTNLGAFAVVIALENDDGTGTHIDDYVGLARTRLPLAVTMSLFMLSLTGLPVSAGFVGKFFVFDAALRAAQGDVILFIVTIVGILTTVISAFYYLRVVVAMVLQDDEGKEPPTVQLKPALASALVISAIGTLVIGVVPSQLFELARAALITITG